MLLPEVWSILTTGIRQRNWWSPLGGKVTGSVTKKTNYLINNDTTSNSSKNKKARELGIPVISEEEFLKLAGH